MAKSDTKETKIPTRIPHKPKYGRPILQITTMPPGRSCSTNSVGCAQVSNCISTDSNTQESVFNIINSEIIKSEGGLLSGLYNFVINSISNAIDSLNIPEKVSDLDNDLGFISDIEGLITPGTGVIITGDGTSDSPYSISASGSEGAIEWGNIVGLIEDQTDLQNELDLKVGALTGDITLGTVTNGSAVATIATNAVTPTKIQPLAVSASRLAANAVTNPKILDAAVTPNKISPGTPGQSLITNGAGAVAWGTVSGLPSMTGESGKFLTNNGTDASWSSVDKSTVGLGNVDNTSDANKPISTATQTALNDKEDKANKATDFSTVDNNVYPTTQAVVNYLSSNPPAGHENTTNIFTIASPNAPTDMTTLSKRNDVVNSSSTINGFNSSYGAPNPDNFSIGSGEFIIHDTDSVNGTTYTGKTTTHKIFTITYDTITYFGLKYNAGVPELEMYTNRDDIFARDVVPLYIYYRRNSSAVPRTVDLRNRAVDEVNRALKRELVINYLAKEPGTLELIHNVNNEINITDGTFFEGHIARIVTGHSFTEYKITVYRDGSGGFNYGNFTESIPVVYDDNSGSLPFKDANKYYVSYVYAAYNTVTNAITLTYVFPQGEFDTDYEATAAPYPEVPVDISKFQLLVGRVIQKGFNIVRTETSNVSLFNQSVITSHNELSDIDGNGTIHLDSTEVGRVRTQASSSTDGYLTAADWNTFNNKADPISGDYVQKSGDTMTGTLQINNNNPLRVRGENISGSSNFRGLDAGFQGGANYNQAVGLNIDFSSGGNANDKIGLHIRGTDENMIEGRMSVDYALMADNNNLNIIDSFNKAIIPISSGDLEDQISIGTFSGFSVVADQDITSSLMPGIGPIVKNADIMNVVGDNTVSNINQNVSIFEIEVDEDTEIPYTAHIENLVGNLVVVDPGDGGTIDEYTYLTGGFDATKNYFRKLGGNVLDVFGGKTKLGLLDPDVGEDPVSTLHLSGSKTEDKIETLSSDGSYEVLESDYMIVVDHDDIPRLDLPLISDVGVGKIYEFKNINSDSTTSIYAQSGDTIDGSASITLTELNQYVKLKAIDSTTWAKVYVEGGEQDLQSVLDTGSTVIDSNIILENTTDNTTTTLDSFGLNINDGTGKELELDAEGLDLKQSSNRARIQSDNIDSNRTHTLPNKSGTIAHISDIPSTPGLQQVIAAGGSSTNGFSLTSAYGISTFDGGGITVNDTNYVRYVNIQAGEVQYKLNAMGTNYGRLRVDQTLTGEKIWTLPAKSGTIAMLSDVSGTADIAGVLTNGNTANNIPMVLTKPGYSNTIEGDKITVLNTGNNVSTTLEHSGIRFSNGGSYNTLLTYPSIGITGNRTYQLPDKSGTIALLDDVSGGATLQQVLESDNIATDIAMNLGTSDLTDDGYGIYMDPSFGLAVMNGTGDKYTMMGHSEFKIIDALGNEGSIKMDTLTNTTRTWTMPDDDGTVALTNQLPSEGGATGTPEIGTIRWDDNNIHVYTNVGWKSATLS